MKFRVVALGSNGSGQLGVGHLEDISKPQPCIFAKSDTGDVTETLSAIVGGGAHSLVLSSKGRVWASGSNEQGRCGLPISTPRFEIFHPVDIVNLVRGEAAAITSVAATWEASIFVIDKRSVLTCGVGIKGELGQGPEITRSPTPKQIVLFDGLLHQEDVIIEAVAGVNHVVLLTSSGEVLGWGGSRKGQLGEDAKADKILWRPRKIKIPFKARIVAAGRDFTYVVGCNDEQLFLGDAKQFRQGVNLPLEGDGLKFGCGWSNIYCLSSRSLAGIGRNDRGQLPPDNLPSIIDFAAGSEHCLALTDDGKVSSWGWGEHGNCGTPVDERGNVMDRYNTVPVSIGGGETISMVAAGCATAFIVLRQG